MNRVFILLVLLAILPAAIFSQTLKKERQKEIRIYGDTIVLDTLSVVPGSLKILYEDKDITQNFSVNYPESFLILKIGAIDTMAGKSLYLSYTVFPFKLSKKFNNKDYSWYTIKTEEPVNPFIYKPNTRSTDILNINGLNKSGSISRAISFGNNQDVVVNSNFNLQLSGKLSREVNIVAAITDNNIPIQPEGNTQQIQEFDKVFIQISARKNILTVGDYELHKPNSYFMNFLKKAQGAKFTTEIDLKKSKNEGRMKIKTAAALSKGKFARNRIQGVEGNQGPYKLRGNEGETYLIVLAGTEKVYIDGKLLIRGENYDYTINYNKGEITFTPNVIITKDKRITVEFEYSDKNYARTLFFLNNEYQNKKLHIRFNAFSESDLKNQSLQQDLTNHEKNILRNVGDSIQDAIIWNIDTSGFSMDEVRYRLTDTTVTGIYYDTVLIYSTNPDSAIYKAGFSNVGQGNGNYSLVRSDANGRVFQWKAPVNGEHQGSYEPIRLLVSPKKNQMVTVGADYVFNTNSIITTEVALTNYNINTFSDKDKSNDVGLAMHLTGQHKIRLGKLDTNNWNLNLGGFFDKVGENFKPIEPYRPVEFKRNWNIISDKISQENFAGASIGLDKNTAGFFNYEFQTLHRDDNYIAYKNLVHAEFDFNNNMLKFDGSYLITNNNKSNTTFIRHKANIARKIKWLMLGLRDDQEHNTFYDNIADSLLINSYSYYSWGAYVKNADSSLNQFELYYNQRTDKSQQNNGLRKSSKANEYGFTGKFEKNRYNRLKISMSYRNLQIYDTILSNDEPERNIIGRIEHFLVIKKGLITANTFYEVGSGLEEKKEFSYLKVPTGEGVYVWIDYNGDGIQQLNEFEIAPFKDEADYIRIFSPSNEYSRVYSNQFSEAFMINPAVIWAQKKGIKKFISRFSNQLTYRIEHKTSEDDAFKAYNPFINEKILNDSLLISLSSNFRNTLYYNRNNSVFGFDINFQNNRSKAFLLNGFETRTIKLQGLNLRWNFYKAFSFIVKLDVGRKTNQSDYFSSRDYKIQFYKTSPEFSYQPGPSLRINLTYLYNHKENVQQGSGIKAIIHDIGFEINYKILNKGSLQLEINYIDISYNDVSNTSLAFEMLEGFQPGRNGTWILSFQHNIAKHLQLNIAYNGRKSPESKTVHVGSIQLRAYF